MVRQISICHFQFLQSDSMVRVSSKYDQVETLQYFLRTKSMSFPQRQRKLDKLSLFWTFGAVIIVSECQEQGRDSVSDINAQDIWA